MSKKLSLRSILVALVVLGASILAVSQTVRKTARAGSQSTIKIGVLPSADAGGSSDRNVADGIGRLVQSQITHTSPNLVARVITLNRSTTPENLGDQKTVELGKAHHVDVVLLARSWMRSRRSPAKADGYQ